MDERRGGTVMPPTVCWLLNLRADEGERGTRRDAGSAVRASGFSRGPVCGLAVPRSVLTTDAVVNRSVEAMGEGERAGPIRVVPCCVGIRDRRGERSIGFAAGGSPCV